MKPKNTISKVIYSALFSAAILFATTSAFAQVKIGTNPTVIGGNSNLEVEAANNKKVIVNKNDGTVVIENTPVGASTDQYLTVDASGNVRKSNLFVPTVQILALNSTGSIVFPAANTIIRADLLPVSEYASMYSVPLKEFTATEAGVYMFTLDINLITTVSASGGQVQLVASNPNRVITGIAMNANNGAGVNRNCSGSINLAAGDKVWVHLAATGPQTISYGRLNLVGLKVHN